MQELSEESNIERLNQRISELDLNSDVVIAFDFDELVVPVHLTRIITQKISRDVDKEKLSLLGSSSFEGIKYLNALSSGQDYELFKKLASDIASETNWREDFENLISEKLKDYSVIIISCGMKDVACSKLKEINFDERNVISGEYEIEEGKIVGSSLVVSDKLKGHVIKKIKENHKVISIGHNHGDKYMLAQSDISIALNPEEPNLAQHSVKSAQEIFDIIEGEAKE